MEVKMKKSNLLTIEQAAGYLGISKHTLNSYRWDDEKGGPAYIKMGGKVAYRIEDLDSWVEACRVEQGE
jgi:excisionase family DNA binding protein